MSAETLHPAHSRCELSEGLALKLENLGAMQHRRPKTCHLNQAFRQYVDSGVPASVASSYSPSRLFQPNLNCTEKQEKGNRIADDCYQKHVKFISFLFHILFDAIAGLKQSLKSHFETFLEVLKEA